MTTPIRAGILTASDRAFRGEREDQSGPLLKAWIEGGVGEVIAYQILPDERDLIKKTLCYLTDRFSCDLILTTGGTGLGPRDKTPEATREVIEKEVPGISEALRREGAKKTRWALLSRGIAGIRNKTLIINLPGSPEAVQDSLVILDPLVAHAVALLRGGVSDCLKERSQFSHSHSS